MDNSRPPSSSGESPRFPMEQHHVFTPPPISISTTRNSTPSESSSSSSPMALPPFSSFFDIPPPRPQTAQQRRRPSRPGFWAPQGSLLRNEATSTAKDSSKDASAMSISSDSRTGSEWGEGDNENEEDEREEVMSLDDLLDDSGKEETVAEPPTDEEKAVDEGKPRDGASLDMLSSPLPSPSGLRRPPRMSILTRVSTLLQLESSPVLEIQSEAALQRMIQSSAVPPTPLSSAFRKSTSTYGRFPESAVVDNEPEEDDSSGDDGPDDDAFLEEDVNMSEGSVWGMRGSPVLERTNGKSMEIDPLSMPSPYRSTPPPFPPQSRKRKRTPSPSSTPSSNSNSNNSSTTTLSQSIPIKRQRLVTTPSSILLPPFHPSSPTASTALASPRPSISIANASPRWARAGLGGGGAYGLGLGLEREKEKEERVRQVDGAGDGVRKLTLEDGQVPVLPVETPPPEPSVDQEDLSPLGP